MTNNLTDRAALIRNRRRASRDPALFLHETAAAEIKDRLKMVNKTFRHSILVGGMSDPWHAAFPEATRIPDDETLDLSESSADLIIHAMGLHWADDPIGQLIQARRALRPDGLFLAIFFGGNTLHELRASLAQAESDLFGGLSPRVAPMGEIRDLGDLLQRAGFALPVADSLTFPVSYADPLALMHDLRAMGETNALAARSRRPMARAILRRACEIYNDAFGTGDGRITATFELVILTGWAPDPGQPQPLRPGSATRRLADALDAKETPLKD